MPLLTLSVGRAVDSIVIFIFCTFVRVFIAGIFLFKIIFLRIILIRIVGFIKFAVIRLSYRYGFSCRYGLPSVTCII